MPNVAVYNIQGQQVGEMALSEEIFGIDANEAVLHQAVKTQLANRRQGTQSALTRAEVRGGGIKPWRQKGTGRARQGSTRSPQWTHGGVAFAPKPRDYHLDMNKKMKRLAMKSALSAKVAENEIMVMENLDIPAAKTREMVTVLKNLKVDGKALLVLAEKDEKVERAARNLPGVKTLFVNTLNVVDILGYGTFIITKAAVEKVEEVYV